jgi:hypothetical protein
MSSQGSPQEMCPHRNPAAKPLGPSYSCESQILGIDSRGRGIIILIARPCFLHSFISLL